MIICDEQQTQVSNEVYKNVHDVVRDILQGAQCSSNVGSSLLCYTVMELISINMFRNLYLSVSACFLCLEWYCNHCEASTICSYQLLHLLCPTWFLTDTEYIMKPTYINASVKLYFLVPNISF